MPFHLKEKLKLLRARTLPSHPDFFVLDLSYNEPTMVTTSAKICAALGNIVPKEPHMEELKEVYDAIIKFHQDHQGLEGISKRLLRKSSWVIFKEVDEKRPPLIGVGKLNTALLKQIQITADPRAILSLAFVFLRTYPKQKPYFEKVSKFINLLVSGLSTPRGQRFAQQSQNYKLFTNDGPEKVVAAIEISQEPISNTLVNCGLHGGCQQEGFVEEMYGKWIKSISASLETADYRVIKVGLGQLLNFSASDSFLRFPNKRIVFAEGMLLPFQNIKPVPACKETLRDFLLKYLGDPRFDKGPWVGVNDNALAVMYGWLTEIVLEDFFRLLDYSAKYDSDADRQWKYRKAFWSACLRNGLIDNAWVALGKRVAGSAEFFLDGKKNIYAEISGSGVQGHHAVLIMRIGNMIITEWSHSGKYRFWNEVRHSCPKLYKPSYVRGEVVDNPDFEGSHHTADRGGWQKKVADYIKSETGFNLPYREYMRL